MDGQHLTLWKNPWASLPLEIELPFRTAAANLDQNQLEFAGATARARDGLGSLRRVASDRQRMAIQRSASGRRRCGDADRKGSADAMGRATNKRLSGLLVLTGTSTTLSRGPHRTDVSSNPTTVAAGT